MATKQEAFKLDRSSRNKIEKQRGREFDKRIYRRLTALLALDDGLSQEEVARLLGVTARTIRDWIKIYRKSGLPQLCQIAHEGRKRFLTSDQLEQVREQVKAGSFRSAKHARKWIADNFDVKYSESAVKDLLRDLGATYHRTTPFLFKADPDKQKKFAPLSPPETEERDHPSLLPGWYASGVGR